MYIAQKNSDYKILWKEKKKITTFNMYIAKYTHNTTIVHIMFYMFLPSDQSSSNSKGLQEQQKGNKRPDLLQFW